MGASDNKILQFSDLKTYNNKVKQYVQANKGSAEKTTLADLGITESPGNINMLSDILNQVYYPYTNGKSMVYTRDISFSISAGASAAYVDTYVQYGYGYSILGYSFKGNVGCPVSAQFYENKGHYYAQVNTASTFTTSFNLTLTVIYTQVQS